MNRLGETVTKESLGGSKIHTRNGAVDDEASKRGRRLPEGAAVPVVSAVLGLVLSERGPVTDDPARAEESLVDAIPRDRRKVYKMRQF